MGGSTVTEDITKACLERSAFGYFYFDFRNERQRVDIMLQSIIWQLSGRSPSLYSTLHRLYKSLGNGTIHPQPVELQGVLEDLLSEFDRTYIIIDGLDECNKTDWNALVQFLCSLYHPTKDSLHLLFTSQPLKEFRKTFKSVAFIELDFTATTGNIRSFVGSEVCGLGGVTLSQPTAIGAITRPDSHPHYGLSAYLCTLRLRPSTLPPPHAPTYTTPSVTKPLPT
ncbi:hypothetical protein C8J57DRAFT_1726923 [Mycena rebaudengoi]|nr:hypothetical protein C8J57DRAFT_1726923 [Mycena rebaudengoi]